MSAVLDGATIGRLRDALSVAGYTVSGVADLLGTRAHDALSRNETTPALRRTLDLTTLATLTRLWPLQATVPLDAAERALPGGLVGRLCAAGVLEQSAAEVRARTDIRPYADDEHDWWIASDLTPGLDGRGRRMSPGHVLGVAAASVSLARLVDRTPVGRALDLGTGSGVQAVHLSTHVEQIVATDVNPRCLELAALTAGLNGVDLDLREGSLFDPVASESFDLIVTNPPFVISPATGERLVYRDSGLPGDEVVRRVVTGSIRRLRPGGRCQLLANWIHEESQPWAERVGGWIAETGCDAWVVQREVTDVAQYVELWLNDAGLRHATDYTARYDAWLRWFADQGVEAIGFGWVTLRNAQRDVPHVTLEEWPYDVEQPIGPAVGRWATAIDALDRIHDDELLGLRLRRPADLVEERVGTPGDADPAHIVLRQQRGMRRARQVTTGVAAMVGACDGDLTVHEIWAALATLLPDDPSALRTELVTAARSMVLEGMLMFPD